MEIDFFVERRQKMVSTMQLSLKQIRQVLNLGVQEFSDIVGMTRQSINNLENSKIKMSTVQYIAICAVIDHFTEYQPEITPIIVSILKSNDTFSDNAIFDDVKNGCFLKEWFSCFPDSSKVITRNNDLISDITEHYKIFLDDTALCEMSDVLCFSELIERMKQMEKKFIIPLRAIDSIHNQLLSEDMEQKELISKGIQNITRLRSLGMADIRGEENDVTILSTLVSVFSKYKMIYRLALITQNRHLANAILALNKDDIVGFPILVLCFSDGALQPWQKIQPNSDCQWKVDAPAEEDLSTISSDEVNADSYESDKESQETAEYSLSGIESWGII